MATYSGRSAVVAFGKQTAEGTPLATPTFETPMGGGSVGPDRATAELPWTSDVQENIGLYVERTSGAFNLELPVLPKSVGALLRAGLGAVATTGAGPYEHVLTPADSLPWYTFHYAQPGANFHRLADAKVDECTLSWSSGPAPLSLSMSGMGKTITRAGSKWATATNVETPTPYFQYAGATMLFDADATPAATQVHNIAGGSITVNRNLEAIQTDGVGYQYIAEQLRAYEITLDDVVFENNDFLNTYFYGAAAGTTPSTAVIYGSCEFTFLLSDGSDVGDFALVVAAPNVMWAVDAIPEADPAGGVVRYTVTGTPVKPASGATLTYTLTNDYAGTAY